MTNKMTDEEIEKWLNDTYRNMRDGYQTSLEHGGKADPDFEEQIDKLGAEIDYINRLKEACQSAIQSFTRMETLYKVKCAELECAKEQTRKDTAKEILQRFVRTYIDVEPIVIILEGIAEEYGVEV